MSESDVETDPAARMALLEDAERLIVEQDVPILPIFRYVQLYMYDPHRLTGLTSDPRQEQEVQELDLLGDGKGADKPRERPARKSRSGEEQASRRSTLSSTSGRVP